MKDTGIGIKPEDQLKLFSLFGRLEILDGLNQNGIGLGLTICKKIINFLGGEIRLQSELGKGSNFIISFFTEIQNVRDVMVTEEDESVRLTHPMRTLETKANF